MPSPCSGSPLAIEAAAPGRCCDKRVGGQRLGTGDAGAYLASARQRPIGSDEATDLGRRVAPVTDAVEEAFGSAEMSVLAFADIYAGKICAALDRQHPRDLYDIHLLYQHEGINDDLFRTFLVYAACSGRPIH